VTAPQGDQIKFPVSGKIFRHGAIRITQQKKITHRGFGSQCVRQIQRHLPVAVLDIMQRQRAFRLAATEPRMVAAQKQRLAELRLVSQSNCQFHAWALA